MLEFLIMLGKGGGCICVFYCFWKWIDPVEKYVEDQSKYVRWLAMGLFAFGMLWIFGSITEIVEPKFERIGF